ncbi:hypothetical protein [Amycolatopsis sp. cmx-4-68]|uniref:hypothetical protein n=1 Tax=Amycolatopsis sp. cmx-4-68 TaxID=2790938 RepID=UPI00397D5330
MTDVPQLPLDPYPGLPRGAFHTKDLPRPAVMAFATTDEGVWTAAVDTYLTVIDPDTGKPDHDRPLENTAAGAVRNAAANCQTLAFKSSARSDDRAEKQESEAAKHIGEAVDLIEHANAIMSEQVTGPDGAKIDGWKLQRIHRQDEEVAEARSASGDSRHLQWKWEKSWRLITSGLLGILDALLLWKPLLNLSFQERDPENIFHWGLGLIFVAVQVLFIDWAARTFVTAERLSADRRSAAGDYNRLFIGSRHGGDRPRPTDAEIAEADQQLSRAYHILIWVAAAVALIGGVRVALLGSQAGLPWLQNALFGVIIGLILGCLIVLMTQLYCRGNLLGDRLRIEREAIEKLSGRFKRAQARVAEQRDNVWTALKASQEQARNAATIRTQTVADYRRAVGLAWTWLGLHPESLDEVDFLHRATPLVEDSAARRADLESRLEPVNKWLESRVLPPPPPPAKHEISTEPSRTTGALVPLPRPTDGRARAVGPRPIEVPAPPKPPHKWMLVGAALTVVVTIATAAFAPATDLVSPETSNSPTVAGP